MWIDLVEFQSWTEDDLMSFVVRQEWWKWADGILTNMGSRTMGSPILPLVDGKPRYTDPKLETGTIPIWLEEYKEKDDPLPVASDPVFLAWLRHTASEMVGGPVSIIFSADGKTVRARHCTQASNSEVYGPSEAHALVGFISRVYGYTDRKTAVISLDDRSSWGNIPISAEPRVVNGFEVYSDWVMPDPPIKGAYACFQFHGTDGISLFWWHPEWGRYANEHSAWTRAKELGFDCYINDNPLCDPDSGSNYKACEDAYRELGFKG